MTQQDLDKTYSPSEIEESVRALYDAGDVFALKNQPENAEPFTIMIPPPNVTGSLHMGHALNTTLQDTLSRYMRMKGKRVLWQPGTDHAGIATQMVVERKLATDGEPSRRELGREKFLEKVWEWKEHSGGTIKNQLRRLGASADFSRERFTMDEGLSKAVLKTFVKLYEDGLIYKDKRLVNWDTHFETAISDLEVIQKEIKGNYYYFKYPLEGSSSEHITIATTRPETMLGDVAVAVHPDDERYQNLIGKYVILPLVGRKIPIVADTYSDPEKGTGAVKITPAHDFNDFAVGKRHNLPLINILSTKGAIVQTLSEDIKEKYIGLDRFAARKQIIEDMDALGLLEKIEKTVHTVPHGDRSDTVIEPFLTDQWYVNVEPLAKRALQAVRDDKTRFVPQNWEKTYFNWLENIEPWCISRQLWWGHQIPAWYGPNGETFVAETEEAAYTKARAELGQDVTLTRDDDVLDTWFSSALWPFSTLGWPDKTPELTTHYPTSVLLTGFDIIFFWVARMMMMGLYIMEDVPFQDVYIHALVRDASGAKMSKSKGNVIDPLDIANEYGADALRMTLAAFAAQGRDIKLSVDRVAGYRNFTTKIWNVARFLDMNGCARQKDFAPETVNNPINQWIVSELNQTINKVSEAIEGYKFNEAANEVYGFVWGTFADWYIELIKPELQSEDTQNAQTETQHTARFVLDQILKLSHPIIPHITESLWQKTNAAKDYDEPILATARWPQATNTEETSQAATTINTLIELISAIRSVRAELNVPAGAKVPLCVEGKTSEMFKAILKDYEPALLRLARISEVTCATEKQPEAARITVADTTCAVLLNGIIDLNAEKERLTKAAQKASEEISRLQKKLSNQGFIQNADEDVIEEHKERLETEEANLNRLEDAIEGLKTA